MPKEEETEFELNSRFTKNNSTGEYEEDYDEGLTQKKHQSLDDILDELD